MLRLGIIDCDSSHCVEFVKRINHFDVPAEYHVHGARVTCAWADPASFSEPRVTRFVAQLEHDNVNMVDSIDAVCDQVDAVLILSVRGTQHLQRTEACSTRDSVCFIDKPLACDAASASRIQQLVSRSGGVAWSSSALRFSAEVLEFKNRYSIQPLGVSTWGPAIHHPDNPGLFHYAIHGIELLFALMGPGVEFVQAHASETGDVITARWRDGRFGNFRGLRRGARTYGFQAFTESGITVQHASTRYAYRNLCRAIVSSFQENSVPVALDESIEIIRFIEAAHQSQSQRGAAVAVESSTAI